MAVSYQHLDVYKRQGDSIAFGCAAKLRAFGAEIALTYLNDKAKPHVEPLARQIDADVLLPLDVMQPGQMQAVFDHLSTQWGLSLIHI